MAPRAWDPFLTPADKASLSARPHRVWGYGERPTLVLIDLYRWVFGDREQPLLEAIKDWLATCGPQAWDALPHVQRLLAAARAAKIPIVYVTGTYPHESGVASWAEKLRPPGKRYGTGRGDDRASLAPVRHRRRGRAAAG